MVCAELTKGAESDIIGEPIGEKERKQSGCRPIQTKPIDKDAYFKQLRKFAFSTIDPKELLCVFNHNYEKKKRRMRRKTRKKKKKKKKKTKRRRRRRRKKKRRSIRRRAVLLRIDSPHHSSRRALIIDGLFP